MQSPRPTVSTAKQGIAALRGAEVSRVRMAVAVIQR